MYLFTFESAVSVALTLTQQSTLTIKHWYMNMMYCLLVITKSHFKRIRSLEDKVESHPFFSFYFFFLL